MAAPAAAQPGKTLPIIVAAQRLYQAWRRNDRPAALKVASPSAVDKLLSVKWRAMKFRGCRRARDEGFQCVYEDAALDLRIAFTIAGGVVRRLRRRLGQLLQRGIVRADIEPLSLVIRASPYTRIDAAYGVGDRHADVRSVRIDVLLAGRAGRLRRGRHAARRSANVTTTGHVTATNGGQPLAGLSADLTGNGATTTDGTGAFTYRTAAGSSARLTLSGAGILTRSFVLALNATRDVAVDAVALTGGFDPAFYREIVRNAFEAPADLQALRRWTRTPSIYLKTVDEGGEAIHGLTLDLIEATVKDAVPQWTSGKLGVPVVERGTATREGQSGWITSSSRRR